MSPERGIDFRSLPEQQRFSEIERLGQHLMAEVGRVVPALPVSLVASAISAQASGACRASSSKARCSS